MKDNTYRVKIILEKVYSATEESLFEGVLREQEAVRLQVYADRTARKIEERLNSLNPEEFEREMLANNYRDDMKRMILQSRSSHVETRRKF